MLILAMTVLSGMCSKQLSELAKSVGCVERSGTHQSTGAFRCVPRTLRLMPASIGLLLGMVMPDDSSGGLTQRVT